MAINNKKIAFFCLFLCLSTIGPNKFANAQSQISTDQVLITERVEKKLKIFLEARNHPTYKGLDFFASPELKPPATLHIQPGQIISIDLSYQEIIQREKNEQQNIGLARVLQTPSGPLYFADYWQNVNALFNTSSGIAIQPVTELNSPFVLYKTAPSQLKAVPSQDKTVPSQSAAVCDETNSNIQCVQWTEQSELFVTATQFVHDEKRALKLIYAVSYAQNPGPNAQWLTGYVFADQVTLRRDLLSCEKEICISRALLANQSKDVEKLFNSLELIEGTKPNKQKWERTFFFLNMNKKVNDQGEYHFNRWITRMNQYIPETEKRDEIAYLFKIRPLVHFGIGYGAFSLEQSGDNNTFEYSAQGPSINFGWTYPLFLDVEWLMDANYIHAASSESDQIDNKLSHFDMTNDMTLSIPLNIFHANYFIGPGMTFRSIMNRANDVGFNTLYGIHLTQGLFFEKWTVYTLFGVTTRDLTGSLSKFEYAIELNRSLPVGSGTTWRAALKYSGYSAQITDRIAATDLKETDNYKSSQIIGIIQREF